MIYEMNKFYKRSPVMVLFVLTVILSIILPIFFIHSYENDDYPSGKKVITKGLNGLKSKKELLKKLLDY